MAREGDEAMATTQKVVDQYRIYYMTGGAESPLIDVFSGSSHVARLSFHAEGAPLPANLVTQAGVFYLRYRLNQFEDVVGLLRHEQPLYVSLTTPSLIGFIGTSEHEPIGEEESQR
jgi:hypothetical protein